MIKTRVCKNTTNPNDPFPWKIIRDKTVICAGYTTQEKAVEIAQTITAYLNNTPDHKKPKGKK